MRKVILFCAATLFSLLSFAQESDADIVKVGDNIPAFTLHSTANGTINSTAVSYTHLTLPTILRV